MSDFLVKKLKEIRRLSGHGFVVESSRSDWDRVIRAGNVSQVFLKTSNLSLRSLDDLHFPVASPIRYSYSANHSEKNNLIFGRESTNKKLKLSYKPLLRKDVSALAGS
ncbi:hypothetical protein [Cellvibrio fibrivorans]|uniref:Uncharacterized protein n=1 Tax=Cellvibrio fibrivorans TaxID=126350 RepID=A0ABU1V420_9GAMM|nr:hypothetical protein [Cellvibrio fibrivorans]MDR7092214.1 hypothetical protein [Cellvibrio fibrivorans]